MKKKKKAFTITEVMLAVAIIAIIAIAFLPTLNQGIQAMTRGKDFTSDILSTQKLVEGDISRIKSNEYQLPPEYAKVKDLEIFGKKVSGIWKRYKVDERDNYGELDVSERKGHGTFAVFLTDIKIPSPEQPYIGEPKIEGRRVEISGKHVYEDKPRLEEMINFYLVGQESPDKSDNTLYVIYRWYTADLRDDGSVDWAGKRIIKEWDPNPNKEELAFEKTNKFISKHVYETINEEGEKENKSSFIIKLIPNIKPDSNSKFLEMEDGKGHDYLRIVDFNGELGPWNPTIVSQNNINSEKYFDFRLLNMRKKPKYSERGYEAVASVDKENDGEFYRDYFDLKAPLDESIAKTGLKGRKAVIFSTTPVSDKGIYGIEKFAVFKTTEDFGLTLDAWFNEALFSNNNKQSPSRQDNVYYFKGIPQKLPLEYTLKANGKEVSDKYYLYIVWRGEYSEIIGGALNERTSIQHESKMWDKNDKIIIKEKDKITNGIEDLKDGIESLEATIYVLDKDPKLDHNLPESKQGEKLAEYYLLENNLLEEPIKVKAVFEREKYKADGRFTTDNNRRLGDIWDLDHGDFHFPYESGRLKDLYYSPIINDVEGNKIDYNGVDKVKASFTWFATDQDIEIDEKTDTALVGPIIYDNYKGENLDVRKEIGEKAKNNFSGGFNSIKYIKVLAKYEIIHKDGTIDILDCINSVTIDKLRKIYYIKADNKEVDQYMVDGGAEIVNFTKDNSDKAKWVIIKDIEEDTSNAQNERIYKEITDLPGHFYLNYGKWMRDRKDFRRSKAFIRYDTLAAGSSIYLGGVLSGIDYKVMDKVIRELYAGKFRFLSGFLDIEPGEEFKSRIFTSRDDFEVWTKAKLWNSNYPLIHVQVRPRAGEHKYWGDLVIERVDWKK